MKSYLGAAVLLVWTCAYSLCPGQAPAASLPESNPLVKSWVPPVYPAELKAEKVQGAVTIQFVVDEKGAVHSAHAVKASDPRFEQAAVDSVSKWTFEPAVESGAHVAMGLGVRLYFKLPERKYGSIPPEESTPTPLPKGEAKAESPPDPEYPAELIAQLMSGEAVVDFFVESDGRISGLHVVSANHPGFVRPVLAAVERMKFTPAMQGDLPVRARMRSPMEFDTHSIRVNQEPLDHLRVNGFSVRLQGEQVIAELCDKLPQRWTVPDPVFPRAAAVGGQTGDAEVDFELDERGNPEKVRLVSASTPEFGQVLVDTLLAGVFKPAMKDGRTVAVPMRWKYTFAQPPGTAPSEGESGEARLIRLLRSGGSVGTAKGLDAKLRPLWRIAPEYPKELRAEGTKGTAEVEFIVDQDGRVRLPQAVTASHEAFARAAVIAASLWVFDPPMREGKPVDVRVRVPFNFAP